jgi:hypothetical protein
MVIPVFTFGLLPVERRTQYPAGSDWPLRVTRGPDRGQRESTGR